MRRPTPFILAAALLIVAGGGAAAQEQSRANASGTPVDLTIVAINDFHGHLKPPPGGILIADPADPARKIRVAAGGAEHMATLVRELRATAPNSVFVAAGDLIGASPLLSGIFADEPTIESLSEMGLDISAVGNHEFDKGPAELLRMQNGGCHPAKGCFGPRPFAGAKFRYLAASTVVTSSGQTLFPPYVVKTFGNVPVAFIGLTLKGTPAIISPSAAAGLRFADEAETVNALVPELRARGIEAIVVLIHEGGYPTGGYNECPGISGAIVDIVRRLDKAVDLVVSGHTHRSYICTIDGRLVTSAESFGTLVTRIDVKLDPRTRDVVSAKAENLVVRTDALAPDRAQTELIAGYEAKVKSLAGRVVGQITATLSRAVAPNGESVLGGIVADAQLAATRAEQDGGAQLAFTNPGGVRTDIVRRDDGNVTYADVFAAQPFNNLLVTLTLTGAQIKALLEQQWVGQQNPRILHVSKNFSYAWDAARPPGERVDATTIRLDGTPLDPAARYRVTVNNFLAEGGDNFVVLRAGTERRTGNSDLTALVAWFEAMSPIAPGALDRIRRVN
jgi:5'-nucleotidase